MWNIANLQNMKASSHSNVASQSWEYPSNIEATFPTQSEPLKIESSQMIS